MAKLLEVIFDTKPSGGCGCNCGCGGSNKVEDMNDLVNELKTYDFGTSINVDPQDIDDFTKEALIDKINVLLENTKAAFRVDQENIDEALENILPLVVLDGNILTAYGVPTLYDVVFEVEKTL